MAHSATKTASILSELYNETFANDSCEPFRITWSDLRGIAGVSKLSPRFLHKINEALNDFGYTLILFDNFLVIAQESDMSHIRLAPPRVVEQYLFDSEEDLDAEDEDEDIELGDDSENPDDCEVDDEEVLSS